MNLTRFGEKEKYNINGGTCLSKNHFSIWVILRIMHLNKRTSKLGAWALYGSAEPRFVIAGHSHTFCMYSALLDSEILQKDFAVIAQSDFSSHKQHNDDYWDFVSELSKEFHILISWNGNQHNIHFLLDNDWQFNAIGYAADDNFPVVALSCIKELFRPTFLELELCLAKFPNKKNLTLLGTPAPKSKLFLDQRVTTDKFFVDFGEKMGISKNALKASQDPLRVYTWDLTQKLTIESGIRFGLEFIPTPTDTYSNEGILFEEYYADDLTHTNKLFGEKMLEYLKEKLMING